jgi:hypothetical protein
MDSFFYSFLWRSSVKNFPFFRFSGIPKKARREPAGNKVGE